MSCQQKKMGILRWSRQAFFITDPIILPDLGSQMLAKQIQALVLGSPSAAFAPGISSGKAPFQQAKEWERAISNRHPRPNLGHQPPSQITKKQNPTV